MIIESSSRALVGSHQWGTASRTPGALLAGESGIARTTLFDASTFPTTISAEVKDFTLDSHVRDLERHRGVGRNTQFAMAACAQAWKSAKLDTGKLDLDRVGIYLGSVKARSISKRTAAQRWPGGPTVQRSSTRSVGAGCGGADERRSRDRAGAQHAALAPGNSHRRARAGAELSYRLRCVTQAIGEALRSSAEVTPT
jgi:hypothetical protein